MKRQSRLNEFRESLRLQESYNTILRYFIDFTLDRGVISIIRRTMLELLYDVPQPRERLSLPVKVRLMLQDLGPIYVKVGQLVSSQAQALPLAWEIELRKLQSSVRPVSYEEISEVFREEMHADPDEIFEHFDHTPLAAASLAQVHRARLKTGEEVVVKLQRPRIQHQVEADVGIMFWLARQAYRRTDLALEMDLAGIVSEFGSQILQELDYRTEAYNSIRLDQNLEGIEGVRLPAIYDEFSSQRVLTMEFIDGIRITDVSSLDTAGFNKQELAETALRATIKQVLIDGFFHGDLHPGNLMVNRSDGAIVYLDTGMVGELTMRQRINMINMLMVLQQGDARGLSQSVRSLSVPFRPVNEAAFERDFERRIGRMMQMTGVPFGEQLNEVMAVLRDNGLQFDSGLTLAVKSLMQMEAASKVLFPEGGLMEVGTTMTLELVQEQVTAEKITDTLKREASYTLRDVASRMPSIQTATLKWLGMYERGRFELYHDTSGLEPQLDAAGKLVRQLVIGILLAGLIVGSAIATAVVTAFDLEEAQLLVYISFGGYVAASVLAFVIIIVLLMRVLKRERKDPFDPGN